MDINLNLSPHAIKQLSIRFPNWSEEILSSALKNNPSFNCNGEIHTYIGTGWDMYEESDTSTPRKRYKRRHLFLVSKPEQRGNKEGYFQPTIVFHTHTSINKRVTNPNCELINEVSEDEFAKVTEGAHWASNGEFSSWWTLDLENPKVLTIAWQYGKFKLIVKNIM